MSVSLSRQEIALYAYGWYAHKDATCLDSIPNRGMAEKVMNAAQKAGHMPVPERRVLWYRITTSRDVETLLLDSETEEVTSFAVGGVEEEFTLRTALRR